MGFKARRGAADCFHLCVKVQSARGQTGQLNRRQQKTSRRYGARAGGRSRRPGTFPAARARARTTPRGVRSSPVSAVCPPVRPLGEAEARRVNSIHAATVTAPSRARAHCGPYRDLRAPSRAPPLRVQAAPLPKKRVRAAFPALWRPMARHPGGDVEARPLHVDAKPHERSEKEPPSARRAFPGDTAASSGTAGNYSCKGKPLQSVCRF